MRTAIIAIGTLLVGFFVGGLLGFAVAPRGDPQEQVGAPQEITREITREVTEFVIVEESPDEGFATAPATVPADGASVLEEAANKECQIGEPCDLTVGEVTVTSAETTDVINTDFDTYSGNFVEVWFEYTYGGAQTAETGEAPWSLVDTEDRVYSMHFDATSSYGIEQDAGAAIYQEVQPGITYQGVIVFEVAPDSEPAALIITDLVNIQGGDVARIEL